MGHLRGSVFTIGMWTHMALISLPLLDLGLRGISVLDMQLHINDPGSPQRSFLN